jgi:hypothetical protein
VKQPWTPLGGGAASASPGDYNGRVTTAFQIGPGLSNQGIVILGAGGGADYQKRPNSYDQPRWEVTIKLDNGQKRVVTVAYEPFVREGERVRVAGTLPRAHRIGARRESFAPQPVSRNVARSFSGRVADSMAALAINDTPDGRRTLRLSGRLDARRCPICGMPADAPRPRSLALRW